MLLTIATTHAPATDLGWLLHKHPGKAQAFDLGFGQAHVFYPEASEARCEAALLLDVDPVGLVRGRGGKDGGLLDQYVNDRPYVASSFLSVALAQVFRSALGGRCKDRPDLPELAMPFEARVAALPCRGGEALLRRLFEPLGYAVAATSHALDPAFPAWGDSPYWTLTLAATMRLRDMLAHLYVLIPVLDDEKHYWVGTEEVEKLLRVGSGWLAEHPEKELIARRYLRRSPRLTREALARLTAEDGADPDAAEEAHAAEEDRVERPLSLNEQRLDAVVAELEAAGARSVADLGCGEGKLLKRLIANPAITRILGMDVAWRELEKAQAKLKLDRLPERRREQVTLIHGSLTYRDARLEGFDAATLVEVIEHLDPGRLDALERVVFGQARPGVVIVTTPNVEYNARFETLPAGRMRHRDHRFEWTRAEFQAWAAGVAGRHGYAAGFAPIGPEDPALGAPTQLARFTRTEAGT